MTCTRIGTYTRFMASIEEKRLKAERAERLVEARKRAGFTGPTAVFKASGIGVNTYKAYEQGRNDFDTATARTLAKLFKVRLQWLYLGEGSIDDEFEDDGLTPQQARAAILMRMDSMAADELLKVLDLVDSFPAKTAER